MKNRIVVNNKNHGKLDFYLEIGDKALYLFSEHYSSSVHRYFYNGRFENEVRRF